MNAMEDDDTPSTPEEIARDLALMEELEPWDISPEELADLEDWERQINEYSIANMGRGLEHVFAEGPEVEKSGAIRGVVRDGKVEVDLPDGTEVLIVPESAEAALAPGEIAQIIATMPPFEWTAEDEAEWEAEKRRKNE